jgi:hypothetical protein
VAVLGPCVVCNQQLFHCSCALVCCFLSFCCSVPPQSGAGLAALAALTQLTQLQLVTAIKVRIKFQPNGKLAVLVCCRCSSCAGRQHCCHASWISQQGLSATAALPPTGAALLCARISDCATTSGSVNVLLNSATCCCCCCCSWWPSPGDLQRPLPELINTILLQLCPINHSISVVSAPNAAGGDCNAAKPLAITWRPAVPPA